MASVTAMMSGVDKGTPIKILSPLQTEGMGLVVPGESSLKDWNSFLAYVKKAKKPVKVGYHSPTSAPKIVLEGSLKFSGIRVTSDPTNMSAQVLLVDLKETTNMVPALASKQVEAIVGPSPFPEVAVSRGVGKIIVNLRDLPPKGYWYDFPCCVTAASEQTIAKHPDIVQKFVELIAKTNVWCNKHRIEAGTLTAEWIGLPGVYRQDVTARLPPEIHEKLDAQRRQVSDHPEFDGQLYGPSERENDSRSQTGPFRYALYRQREIVVMEFRTVLVRIGAYLLVPVLFLVLWGVIDRQLNNEVILPGVGQVAALFLQPTESLIAMGSLATNVAISLVRVLAGYLLAVCLAIPLGILMGYYGTAHRLLNGFLALFRPIPPLAWVPLVLAWFGVASLASMFGVEEGTAYLYLNNLKLSMVFIIFIGAFYPVLTSAIHGVMGVRSTLLDSARVLGAGEWDIFRKILLPAASPSIVNGMRIGLGVAWMCLVSAEMLPGSISGVGYLITHAYTLARTDIVIAGMISIGIVGAVLDLFFRLIEDRKFVWTRLTR
jgi:ABC-type nitrate/sulfonate/bicarbonate transport system permease component/ABC-type nitrate/sulfonate/bicarbonate transport system substrate-binding protein